MVIAVTMRNNIKKGSKPERTGSGMILVRIYWHGFLITGLHGKTALLMLPMMLFGLISGYVMNKTRQKRPVLPLAHGINNLILTLLALTQLITGWGVIQRFVLGG